MSETKIDPRVLRTRKLIMDSFIELSGKKEFRDITVKDITTEAMINRATFYYHFADIYDLLEKSLSEVLMINLDCRLYEESGLSEDTMVSIFKAITEFQLSLSNRCHRGYEDTIARIIRDQLEVIFTKLLSKQHITNEGNSIKITAVMLSWGLYGASVEWSRDRNSMSSEEYIKTVTPTLLNGINNM